MGGTKTIFLKELKRVFKDPKMIFSLFLLPVLLMVMIYGLMGYLSDVQQNASEEHVSIIYVQNSPEGFDRTMDSSFNGSNDVTYLNSGDDLQAIKDGIYNGTVDLLVTFPEDFLTSVEEWDDGDAIPEVMTFYNPTEDNSSLARSKFISMLSEVYEKELLQARIGDLDILTIFTIDTTNEDSIIQNQDKASGQFLSMMLPYLITILLFAGTMSLGADSIAGEKERGTMASMLVTPVSHSSIVMGKLLSLTVLAILSALVYIAALSIAMPMTMSTQMGGMSVSFSAEQILMIAGVVLSLAFLYVALVSIVSVFSRTVKEASTYMVPLYMLVIVAGLFTMMSSSATYTEVQYLIPIYNCSIALGEIFTNELTGVHAAMTILSTLAVSGVLTVVIVNKFGDEKVMFNA